jgi:hypothetical protein
MRQSHLAWNHGPAWLWNDAVSDNELSTTDEECRKLWINDRKRCPTPDESAIMPH